MMAIKTIYLPSFAKDGGKTLSLTFMVTKAYKNSISLLIWLLFCGQQSQTTLFCVSFFFLVCVLLSTTEFLLFLLTWLPESEYLNLLFWLSISEFLRSSEFLLSNSDSSDSKLFGDSSLLFKVVFLKFLFIGVSGWDGGVQQCFLKFCRVRRDRLGENSVKKSCFCCKRN